MGSVLVIKVKFNFVGLDIHVQVLAVSLVWVADKDDKLGENFFLEAYASETNKPRYATILFMACHPRCKNALPASEWAIILFNPAT